MMFSKELLLLWDLFEVGYNNVEAQLNKNIPLNCQISKEVFPTVNVP